MVGEARVEKFPYMRSPSQVAGGNTQTSFREHVKGGLTSSRG